MNKLETEKYYEDLMEKLRTKWYDVALPVFLTLLYIWLAWLQDRAGKHVGLVIMSAITALMWAFVAWLKIRSYFEQTK